MSIIRNTRDPLNDGRQSENALKIQRGVSRMFRTQGFACLPELTLGSGRRADLICIGIKCEIIIVEIKSSVIDFQVDKKWPEYLQHCDQFYFATSPDVPLDIFPQEQGLIVSDGYNAEIIRAAESNKLSASTRKAVLLRYAHDSANRLQDLMDPESIRRSAY